MSQTNANTQAAAEEKKPCVLIVDDSPDVHRLLRARLRQEEIDIISATNGQEAIQFAQEHVPAIILLDLDMPGMDGFEVLRTLKDTRLTVEIPVIMLSGLVATQDKVTAFELGSVDYITKPFEFTELRVRLRSALKLHKLVQLLGERARVDGLTGLWNRAYFDERWQEEFSRVSRTSRPLSIALFDVDHFKSVNDTFGHPAGDAVLTGLGKLLRQQGRASDIPCRYGGEEFCMIMPDTKPEDAIVLCERLRKSLEAMLWPRHPERKITMSIGVSGMTEASTLSAQQVIDDADQNLYQAKRTGRNRVFVGGRLAAPAADVGAVAAKAA
ncbi:MAG: diguanylate cyclase [Planctomycetes bacterium]|nr:diguanylate cyclase [Planctomycetota bacterium]